MIVFYVFSFLLVFNFLRVLSFLVIFDVVHGAWKSGGQAPPIPSPPPFHAQIQIPVYRAIYGNIFSERGSLGSNGPPTHSFRGMVVLYKKTC